jgi:hypothetical protein
MLTNKSTILPVLALILISFQSNAQDNISQSLSQQYNSLIEDSETFNEYKVIKKTVLNDFWKVVGDSISENRAIKKEAFSNIKTKQAQIDELNQTIETKNQELAEGEEEKTSIAVLGVNTNKSLYAIVSIIIPFVLLVVIGALVVKIRANVITTKTAVSESSKMESEYEDYKKKAMDIQMKLKRELQTERNKLMEISR